jgi:hypothetical protein
MVWGGFGFEILKINTTKEDTKISLRDAVSSYMLDHPVLPECEEENPNDCESGVAIEDGRIRPTY